MKKVRIQQDWLFWKDGKEQEKRRVDLPHDAMLLEERDPELEGGSGSGYFPGGKYYYEKRLFGEKAYEDQAVILEFEGVYMNAAVWFNGEKAGGWVYGYTNFFVDLTGKIRIGEENVLLVEVDNSHTPNSRWYSGSGIYRPVNLWTGGLKHITPQGLRVKTCSIEPAVLQFDARLGGVVEDFAYPGKTVEESGKQNGVQEASSEAYTVVYRVYEAGKEIACVEGASAKEETADETGASVKEAAAVGTGAAAGRTLPDAGPWSVGLTLPDAKLWSAEEPNLYTLKAVLKKGDTVLDEAETVFGIRTLAWSAEEGFQVNGRTVKFKGGCIHHDHGILGACTYDGAERRRVKKLKEFGFNAIRYSHYPAGKNLLAACDELGMYVLDESFDQWRIPNTKYDYSTCFDAEWKKDLTALAEKDYNHPSVVMYCIGNEISDTGRSYGAALARELYDTLRAMDDTRPVTIATNVYLSLMASLVEQKELEQGGGVGSVEVNELMAEISEFKKTLTPEKMEELVGGSFDAVDIAGYNYGHDLYEKARKLRPNRIILSSETNPCKMAANWRTVVENDWCIGDFLWTAWDYLGEAGVGLPVYGAKEAPFAKPYPCLTAACGSFDLIGNPEAAAYYEAVLWGAYEKPYIVVRPVNHSGEDYTVGAWRLTDALSCWTWEGCEGRKAEIIVYSAGKELELRKDGVSLGRKPLVDCKAEFETEYQPGMLEAVSYDGTGKRLEICRLKTAGDGIRLNVQPEETYVEADADKIVFVPVTLTDAEGTLRVMTDQKITVQVDGEGKLLALGSGRPETTERFDGSSYTAWHGSVLAIIRLSGRPGTVTVTASCEGCESTSAVVQVL